MPADRQAIRLTLLLTNRTLPSHIAAFTPPVCRLRASCIRGREAVEVVVGLPRSLSGSEGPAAEKARAFAARLARRVAPTPVRLCDERLTTVSAESMLREQGRHGSRRRAVVDMAAAVLILQTALDTERSSGQAPGEIVEVADE